MADYVRTIRWLERNTVLHFCLGIVIDRLVPLSTLIRGYVQEYAIYRVRSFFRTQQISSLISSHTTAANSYNVDLPTATVDVVRPTSTGAAPTKVVHITDVC